MIVKIIMEVKAGMKEYIKFYNYNRQYQSLN